MGSTRPRLPAAWRVIAAVLIVALGIAGTQVVHFKQGVPLRLSLSAIGCGAVLRFWALGIWLVLAFGFVIEQSVAGRHLSSNGSGDNLAAEADAGFALIIVFGAWCIVIGAGLGALIARAVRSARGHL